MGEDKELEQYGIGRAIKYMKYGLRLARKIWGEGVFIYYVPEGRYDVRMEAIKGVYIDDKVPYGAYIAIKNSDGIVTPWIPNQTDLLAEDFAIVEVV